MLTNRLRGVPKNYQAAEQLEGASTNHEQIDGRDPSGMIL
jgi:hypothetical protein